MVTKKTLFSQLEGAGVKHDDVVHIHSSMKAFGRFEGDMDGLIDAFCEYLTDGLFTVPTHTWATVNKRRPLFDVKNETPCTGLLPKTAVLRMDGARSKNPTHSMVVFGKKHLEFVAGEEEISTPTPRNGCYGKLIDRDGVILLVGVGHNRNTFLHCLEETANVPYRLAEKLTPFSILEDGILTPHPMKTIHCPYYKDVSRLFPMLQPLLSEGGADTLCTLGEADTIACRAKRASEILLPVMKKASENGSDYLLPDACDRYEKLCNLVPFYRFLKR